MKMLSAKGILLSVSLFWVSLASIYTENTYFPRISQELVSNSWQDAYKDMDVGKTKFSCSKTIHNKGNSFYSFSSEWDGKKTSGTPSTFVIVPDGAGSFTLDVKYVDHTYVFDTYDNSNPECYVIPPYKPHVHVHVIGGPMNIYALKEVENSSDADECTDFDPRMMSKCKVVGLPVSYDLPVHPFFLTASNPVNADDITMYTAITIDRIMRLKEMAEGWKGPVSAAVAIRDHSEIAQIWKVWSESKIFRMNVDIHLVYDDQYKLMRTNLPPVPINYIRSVSLRNTRTKLVFYVEGDYVPSANLRGFTTNLIPTMLKNPKMLYGVMVVVCNNKVTADMIPASKEDLKKYIANVHDESLKISKSPYASYNSYKFDHWLVATDMYKADCNGGFEPYYIGHRDYPLFDEVFFGCGRDKVIHLEELSRAGYSLNILPDGFIAHLDSTGLGKPWCVNWGSDVRTSIKKSSFNKRLEKGIGFNTYVAPWIKADLLGGNNDEGNKDVNTGANANKEVEALEVQNKNEVEAAKNEWNAENEKDRVIQNLQEEIKRLGEEIEAIRFQTKSSKKTMTLTFSVVGTILVISMFFFSKTWYSRKRRTNRPMTER